MKNQPPRRNPIREDPTRTRGLRRQFEAVLSWQFRAVAAAVLDLVDAQDAFGLRVEARSPFATPRLPRVVLTGNTQWAFATDPSKVEAFRKWLAEKFGKYLIGNPQADLWEAYVRDGFEKGAGRAFDDVNQSDLAEAAAAPEKLAWYNGSRDEFLRAAFAHPVAAEKVKLLVGRAFDEMKGVTADTGAKMARALADGLVQGKGPRDVARDLVKQAGLGKDRALLVAQTEIIRAHAEGQLEALDRLGVEEVGAAIEWVVTGDGRTCPRCSALAGVVLKISEARGMLPLHPRCRCAWVPANVGERAKGQKRAAGSIGRAFSRAGVKKQISLRRPKAKV